MGSNVTIYSGATRIVVMLSWKHFDPEVVSGVLWHAQLEYRYRLFFFNLDQIRGKSIVPDQN
jgi:hypothetical protein